MHRVFAFIVVCFAAAVASGTAGAQDHAPPPAHDHAPAPAHSGDPGAHEKAAPPGAAEPGDAHPPGAPAPVSDPDEEEFPEHEQTVMKVGFDLDHIAKFDVQTGSFTIEGEVTVTCDRKCDPKLALSNGRLTAKLDELEKIPAKNYKKWRLKGEVDGEIDFSDFPFDSHVLGIEIENKADPSHTTIEIDSERTKTDKRLKVPGYEIVRNGEIGPQEGPPEEFYLEEGVRTYDIDDGQTETHAFFGIHLKKAVLPAFIKSIVPLIAMLFGVGISLLLRPKSIGARFGAAASGLVPLVMFHVAQVIGLPLGTGLTRFDKFMVMTYIVYLIHHCFNVAILRSEEVKNEARSMKLYLIAAGLVPGLALVLWLLVFLKFV